jgi:basic amino acid/polyamine antiporter, APA family
MRPEDPQQVIDLREAITLIIGIVVGAGIFKAPSMVAGQTGSVEWMFAAWLLGGVLSLVGALCYAELATTYAHAGGDYHFLHRAYGRSVSFLFGWARFSVIATGSIALLAFVFGDYMQQALPLPELAGLPGPTAYAALVVIGLSIVNLRGTRASTGAQTWLTLLEVGGLVLVVAAGAFFVQAAPPPAVTAPAAAPSLSAFGLAMVFVLLTYGGWNEAAYISAELKDVRRNMVRALTISITLLTLLYLLVTWSYWRGLGLEQMAKSDALAADLLRGAFGEWGARAVSIMVAISALTSINATMIVGARSSFALGRDWPALASLGVWDAAKQAPVNALRVQAVAALVLLALGTWTGTGFRSMVEFTAPVFWLFFLLAGIALFVLRRRDPAIERPFRVPLYPVLPLVFCATCGYMLWSSLSYVRSQSVGGINAGWIGVAVLATGVVLLLALRISSRAPRP